MSRDDLLSQAADSVGRQACHCLGLATGLYAGATALRWPSSYRAGASRSPGAGTRASGFDATSLVGASFRPVRPANSVRLSAVRREALPPPRS